jgi:ribosomal protein L28
VCNDVCKKAETNLGNRYIDNQYKFKLKTLSTDADNNAVQHKKETRRRWKQYTTEKIWRGAEGVEMEMEISDMGMKKQTGIKVTVEQRPCHSTEMELDDRETKA